MKEFNLGGTGNELRLEICSLQKDYATIQECNKALKENISNDVMGGFFLAALFLCVFIFGWGLGKTMS